MSELEITVKHSVSPDIERCIYGGDFWVYDVCPYHRHRNRRHGKKAPTEINVPKCILFNKWLEKSYRKCEECKQACRKRGIIMRVISQDNKKDFPYEMCTIWTLENKIFASPIGESETAVVMAEYTSQEKVEKAMETLHNYYGDYMTEKVYKQEIRSMCPVFQFPQEDEI